jgi:hypothetical protein
MSPQEMTAPAEAEDFLDELSDEALDRQEGEKFGPPSYCFTRCR